MTSTNNWRIDNAVVPHSGDIEESNLNGPIIPALVDSKSNKPTIPAPSRFKIK